MDVNLKAHFTNCITVKVHESETTNSLVNSSFQILIIYNLKILFNLGYDGNGG